jgi:hypothetical protein
VDHVILLRMREMMRMGEDRRGRWHVARTRMICASFGRVWVEQLGDGGEETDAEAGKGILARSGVNT